jgi:hypothetical protein
VVVVLNSTAIPSTELNLPTLWSQNSRMVRSLLIFPSEGTIFRWGLSPVADPHFFIVEIECGDKVVLFLLFRKEKGRFNDPIPY